MAKENYVLPFKISYDLSISFFGYKSETPKRVYQGDSRTSMFTTALFMTAKTQGGSA